MQMHFNLTECASKILARYGKLYPRIITTQSTETWSCLQRDAHSLSVFSPYLYSAQGPHFNCAVICSQNTTLHYSRLHIDYFQYRRHIAQKSMYAFLISRHTYFRVAQTLVRNVTSFRAVTMLLFNILNIKKPPQKLLISSSPVWFHRVVCYGSLSTAAYSLWSSNLRYSVVRTCVEISLLSSWM